MSNNNPTPPPKPQTPRPVVVTEGANPKGIPVRKRK